MKHNAIRYIWRFYLGIGVACLLTLPFESEARGDNTLTVSVNQPSDDIVYDGSGNAFVVFGDDPADFTFDCSVDEDPQGEFHYSWDFGSGDPSSSDDSTDSSGGPATFASGTTVTVNADDELDDGTICASGSDSIKVSQMSFQFQSIGQDNDGNTVYFQVPDDVDEADDNGELPIQATLKIGTTSAVASTYFGSVSDDDNSSAQFVDDSGGTNDQVTTDGSGTFTVTYKITTDADDGDVNLTVSNN